MGESIVYFIQDSIGLIKIGTTKHMRSRLRALRTHNGRDLVVLGIQAGGVEVERSIHARFADLRQQGEWFCPSPELLRWISENTSEIELTPKEGRVVTCAFTIEATRWLNRLIELRNERCSLSMREMWIHIANDMGCLPGAIENLYRARSAGVLASEYFGIKNLLVAEVRLRMRHNEAELSAVSSARFEGSIAGASDIVAGAR